MKSTKRTKYVILNRIDKIDDSQVPYCQIMLSYRLNRVLPVVIH